MRQGGHLFSLSFASGEIPSVNLLDLHRLQASITGLRMFWRVWTEQDINLSLEMKIGLEIEMGSIFECKLGF